MVNTDLISKSVNSTQIQDGSITEADIDPTSKILTTDNSKTVTGKTLDIITNILKNVTFGYNSIIFKDSSDSLYKLVDCKTGTVTITNADPDTVFQTAITSKGDIYVADGTYTPSGAWTGWNFINFTRLTLSRNAIISIPNGYSGYVFKLPSNCQNVVYEGGIIQEAGVTPAKNWDCFLLEGNTNGVYSNVIRDVRILSANRTFNLLISASTGWINCNYFENIWSWWSKTAFVDFNITGTGIAGFGRNEFNHCVFQSNSVDTSMIGVKNINGNCNMFVNVQVWDVTPPQKMSTIASTAQDTLILGGIMTSEAYFTDNSSPSTTQIIDSFSKVKFSSITLNRTPLTTSGPITGRKTGKFDASNSSNIGNGIFTTFTTIGTLTGNQTNTTNGNACRYTSGAVAGNAGGHKYSVAYTTRAWNPYLGVRFKIGTATNNRVFIGWNNGVDPAAGSEDPLLNLSGVLLVQRSTDTTFQISTNAGTATSTFIDTGVTIDNTTVYTFEIKAIAASNKFQWSLNGSAWADLTTNIPSTTFYLAYTAHIQTAEAVVHTIDIFAVETVSDK